MSSKYINVPKHPGVRKNVVTGKYQALKKIKGKQYSDSFLTIREALNWRNTFNGVAKEGDAKTEVPKTTSTLGQVWAKMQELHFPSLEKSTREIWKRRWVILSELSDYHMEDITSTVINKWIERAKKRYLSAEYKALGRGCSGRCNLDNELRLFTTIFNWYKEEDEFEAESQSLSTPIRERHRTMSFIKDVPVKASQKKITVDAAFEFFSALKPLYADLAMTQFYSAGRIGEIAGIQIANINLKERRLEIKESISWCNSNKMFDYLKPFPKNREPREVYIHDALFEIIERRLKQRVAGSSYLFHVEGRPLNYCTIQSNYREAQRKTGIPYRGTHCLRHGMATLARKVGGMGLDSVVAMTGHKDLKLADHYSAIDREVQKETSLNVLKHIQGLGLGQRVDRQSDVVVPFRKLKSR